MVLFNHIYEHMHNPDGGMAEIRRVLKDEGVVYLGLGNRLGITELHYAVLFAALSIQPARKAVHRLRRHAWRRRRQHRAQTCHCRQQARQA
jgi:SAM-dependent methyltransferase